jgi:putative oxidoreductase
VHFLIVVFLAHAGDPFGRRELPLFFFFAAVLFALAGPGRYSVDAMLRGRALR